MLDAMVSHHVMTKGLVNVADFTKFGFADLTIILSNHLILYAPGHCWYVTNSDLKQTEFLYPNEY